MAIPAPLVKLLFSRKEKLRQEALKEERLPLSDMKAIRRLRFRAIIRHAYDNVPYYRKRFEEAHIVPDDIQDLDDIRKVPITSKEDLIEDFPDGVRARNLPERRFVPNKTSGSSGRPFAYFNDRNSTDEERKALFRFQNAMGVSFGDRIIRMRNNDVKGSGLLFHLQRRLGNTRHLTTRDMCHANMHEIYRKILESHPVVLESFPHHILALAEYMRQQGLSLHVRCIYLAGGNVSPQQKDMLAGLFNAKVFNEYGASECMRIAYQCEMADCYHIEALRYHVEFLNHGMDARPGEAGEIVVTDLCNYAMPFIRYRIKDLAEAGGSCSCGRTFPVLKKIIGRVQQAIFLPNGKLMDPNLIREEITKLCDCISGFQSVYTKDKILELRIVPTERYSPEIEKKIVENVERVTKGGVQVKVVKVGSIPLYGEEQKEMCTFTEIPPDLTRVM